MWMTGRKNEHAKFLQQLLGAEQEANVLPDKAIVLPELCFADNRAGKRGRQVRDVMLMLMELMLMNLC
jgi:hypothetical protein